jgi:hypothetical protein
MTREDITQQIRVLYYMRYVCTKTADQILASIGNYCTRINDSGR